MKRLLSTLVFAAALFGLGALALAAMPGLAGSADVADAPAEETIIEAEAAVEAGAAVEASVAAINATTKYNALTVVLSGSVNSAATLVESITSTTNITIVSVLKWNPNTGFAFYNTENPSTGGSTDFSLAVGDPVFIEAQGTNTDTYTIVGEVPAQNSVSFSLEGSSPDCKWNHISIPLDQGSVITNAASLTSNINNGGDVLEQILEWDPDTGFAFYNPDNPSSGGSTNFAVSIGYPYFVCMTGSQTWPTP